MANKTNDTALDRKTELLAACYDLLKQAREAHYTISAMETIVHYDDADCDGMCLMEDIADELGLEDSPEGKL